MCVEVIWSSAVDICCFFALGLSLSGEPCSELFDIPLHVFSYLFSLQQHSTNQTHDQPSLQTSSGIGFNTAAINASLFEISPFINDKNRIKHCMINTSVCPFCEF